MSNREEVQIGANRYFVRKFDAFRGLKVLGDLQKSFIAPFLSVLDGKAAGSEEAVTAGVMAGVERVLRDMDGDKLEAMARKLLPPDHVSVAAPGEEARKLDESAIGLCNVGVADLLELCVFVAKHNYGDLFQRAGSVIGAVLPSQKTPLSPNSPAGSLPN